MAVKASTPPAMRVLVRKRTKAIIVAGGMAVMAVAGGGWHDGMRVLVRKRTKAIIVAGGMAVMAVATGAWQASAPRVVSRNPEVQTNPEDLNSISITDRVKDRLIGP